MKQFRYNGKELDSKLAKRLGSDWSEGGIILPADNVPEGSKEPTMLELIEKSDAFDPLDVP